MSRLTRPLTRPLTACLMAAGLLAAGAAPAMAGDVAPGSATKKSPVGDWRTRTDGVKQTITFTKDGKVFGDAGCNRFTGTYTSTAAGELSIGPLASTMMMCAQQVMDAETTFLVRLQAAVGFNVKPRTLQVFAPKDLVTFRKA